jgi:Na+/phosphate symporter
MDNEEQTHSQGKTLIVNLINHKTLSLMKIEGEFKSVDDVISKLIESHNKLMELKQKEKRKK